MRFPLWETLMGNYWMLFHSGKYYGNSLDIISIIGNINGYYFYLFAVLNLFLVTGVKFQGVITVSN